MSRKTTRKQRQEIFGLSEIIKQDKEISALQKENAILRAQLAEAQRDSARLDFMTRITEAGVYPFLDKYAEKFTIEIDVIGGWVEIGCGKTPREAIDNAMKGGE